MSEILETYWAPHFGNTVEAKALVSHLSSEERNPLEVHALFEDLGLDSLSGNYTDTDLEGFGDAFLVVASLAVLMAENKAAGGVDLNAVGGNSKTIKLHVDSKENTQINTALKYFALSPEDHSAAERIDEDELSDLANLCEQLRGQLD